jgi:hypothetical protein
VGGELACVDSGGLELTNVYLRDAYTPRRLTCRIELLLGNSPAERCVKRGHDLTARYRTLRLEEVTYFAYLEGLVITISVGEVLKVVHNGSHRSRHEDNFLNHDRRYSSKCRVELATFIAYQNIRFL